MNNYEENKNSVNGIQMPDCPICHDAINEQIIVTPNSCKHEFHYSCLIKTLVHGSKHYPMCRSNLNRVEFVRTNGLISRVHLNKSDDFVKILQTHTKDNVTLEGYSHLYLLRNVTFPRILDITVTDSTLHNQFIIKDRSQYEELNPLLDEYMDVSVSHLKIPNARKLKELKTKLFINDGKLVSFSRVFVEGTVDVDELDETSELEKLAKYFQESC